MTTTSTDPRDIEADLERERAALATTLDTLSDRVSVDHIAKEALGMLKGHAGSATSTIDHAVRANPMAVALIGAGVAWMVVSNMRSGNQSKSGSSSTMGDIRHDAAGQSYSSGYGQNLGPASSAPVGSYAYNSGGTGQLSSYSSSDDDHSWSREAHGLRARAVDALHRIEQEAKSYYASLRSGISGMTSGSSSSGSRDFDAERQSVISSFTSDLKSRFSAGLDSLPEGSREQIVAARERAYRAMVQAEQTGRQVIRDPSRAMEEHPFAAGAVAFALGAAAAAVLPSTDAENRAFGSERDRLMDEAARMFRQERERAMQVAGSVGQSLTDEVKAAAQETVEAVADTVTQKAQEAAHRVTDRASEELRNVQGGSGSSTGGSMGSGSVGSGLPGAATPGSTLAGPGDPVVG